MYFLFLLQLLNRFVAILTKRNRRTLQKLENSAAPLSEHHQKTFSMPHLELTEN